MLRGQAVEVTVGLREWISGVVVGSHPSPYAFERFERYDVRASDGRLLEGVHPDAMRVVVWMEAA